MRVVSIKHIAVAFAFSGALLSSAPLNAARSNVVTYSRADLDRLMSAACGANAATRKPIHIHRNVGGTMAYLISEDHVESVIYASSQQCNEISTDTLDMWRDEKGEAVAELVSDEAGKFLLVGKTPLRGKRFDVERTGRYLCTSHGTSATINAVDRPYRTFYSIGIDAQRIFVRRRALLLVGGNAQNGLLEARVLRIDGGQVMEEPPINVGNMPGAVRVLDYSEKTDELLLGGVDASGQAAFVVFNLGTGESSSVQPDKPGDDGGMFVNDSGVRGRIAGGEAQPAQHQTRPGSGQPQQPGNILRRTFGREQ